MIDIGDDCAGFRIFRTERGGGSAQAVIQVETMAATRVANPITVVDEIDKVGMAFSTSSGSTSITTSLLPMLEQGTARHSEFCSIDCPST